MPRALTEQEKCAQCRKLLEKGKAVVLSQGIRRVSVDDITKAAGMAKGTFYQHFKTKEEFLFALIENIHKTVFVQAEKMIREVTDLKTGIKDFLLNLFDMPEMSFFVQHEHEINGIFFGVMPDSERQSFMKMENELFERIIKLAGLDTEKVKPGVVHNHIHSLYITMGSDLMMKKYLPETIDNMIDGLIAYIFKGSAT